MAEMRLITPPAALPVSLAEAKRHLRLEETALDDAHLTDLLIPAAQHHVEQALRRGIVTQVVEAILPAFPASHVVELPWGKLVSVTIGEDTFANGVVSVKYIDSAGVQQTLATSQYVVDGATVPGRVLPAYGITWPDTRVQWDALVVRYAVGWEVADVPSPIKQACLLLVSQMYEHRTPEVLGAVPASLKFAVDSLLAPYRILEV